MNRGLLVALIALTLVPAVRGTDANVDPKSDRVETGRAAPAATLMAQRCAYRARSAQVECF
jgi:hypothetical protein